MLPSFLLALFSRESLPGQRWQYRRTTCSRKASLFQRCRHHLFPSLCSILSTLWTFHYEKKDPFELNSTNITMSSAPGNIFLTTENLAFSLPLILVCGSYVSLSGDKVKCTLIGSDVILLTGIQLHWLQAYFKYVPLYIGLPILGGIAILYQISAQIKAREYRNENARRESVLQLLILTAPTFFSCLHE